MPIMPKSDKSSPTIAPRLGLWDTVSIIIGIVVGTAIFRTSTLVFDQSGGPWAAMALWLVGGAIAWCGAVCYAELATTYPRDGGDYEYLNRAFGPWCGFLFGWAQLTTVVSGNIAIMAYAFADYAVRLWPTWNEHTAWLAVAPILVLSVVNGIGIASGKWTQNLLTAAKVLGIAGLVVAGFWATSPGHSKSDAISVADNGGADASIGLALVFVMYAYGGWSHAAYVAAEVHNPQQSIPRALLLGVAGITGIYLVVNAAYLAALGFDGARHTPTPAAEVLELATGPWGGRAISLLVMLSALGAINGMILTATRIYAVLGGDYPPLAWLASWNRRSAAPVVAIAVQAAIATCLVALVGTAAGRNLFDAVLMRIGASALPWDDYLGGFEQLVAGSAPVYWGLSLGTGAAVFVLRARDRTLDRPYRIPLFPLPPLVFCGSCAFMLYASLAYAGWLSLIGVLPLALGAVLWFVVRANARPN
jgi:amino acid transporter